MGQAFFGLSAEPGYQVMCLTPKPGHLTTILFSPVIYGTFTRMSGEALELVNNGDFGIRLSGCELVSRAVQS